MKSFLRSRLFLQFVIPATVTTALVGGVLAGLAWSAAETDAAAALRQQRLVENVLASIGDKVAHEQESVTIWSEAVEAVDAGRKEWIDQNIGAWMGEYHGHDGAVVLDGHGSVVDEYSSDGANVANPGFYADLVSRLRARMKSESVTLKQGRGKPRTIGEADIRVVGGHPSIVSVKPILSDDGSNRHDPEQTPVHVAIRYLDGVTARGIGAGYGFDEMHYAGTPERGLMNVPLRIGRGSAVGYMAFRPFTPGADMLPTGMTALGAAGAAMFAVLVAFGGVLHRRSRNLARTEADLVRLASRDPLTGLLNRAAFNELAEECSGSPCCVLFVDLDRFKAVNDSFGHPVGDKLIEAVARKLSEVVGSAPIARIGGDEFVILLQGADAGRAEELGARIVSELRNPFHIADAILTIGASVGAAVSDGDVSATELVRQADIALYHAKEAGRNRCAVFGDHMERLVRERRELESDLKSAASDPGQIMAYFQPVYDSSGITVTSAEALLRWKHPTRGMVPPDVFIPIAEEIGSIHELGARVLDDACTALGDLPGVGIAINASMIELASDGYPLRVLSILGRHGVSPSRLEIEVTESVMAESGGRCEANIAALREVGVRFAIDDFGTGYSSFGRIQNLNVDRIKIDKSFIRNCTSEKDAALVRAIVSVADARGLRTTAEGVETSEQSAALKAMGCTDLQGFLFSAPVPSERLHEIVAGQRAAA